MAADIRPFKSKEQDGQGNEVIIRDQQLVEQTSQTTMASGEYFEIVDVDGRMAKIPKDNMINVVREALGSLLNGLADQTTVTKALTLNGDTLGASTAATLASVLGAISGEFNWANGQLTNVDVLTTDLNGLFWFTENSNITNTPITRGYLLRFGGKGLMMCIDFAAANLYLNTMFSGNWSGWKSVSLT